MDQKRLRLVVVRLAQELLARPLTPVEQVRLDRHLSDQERSWRERIYVGLTELTALDRQELQKRGAVSDNTGRLLSELEALLADKGK